VDGSEIDPRNDPFKTPTTFPNLARRNSFQIYDSNRLVGWRRNFWFLERQLLHLHGEEIGPESDLMYYRNRYYSPGLGRFTTRDPREDWYVPDEEIARVNAGSEDNRNEGPPFLIREPGYYADGLNLYRAYFAPATGDPSGLGTLCWCGLVALPAKPPEPCKPGTTATRTSAVAGTCFVSFTGALWVPVVNKCYLWICARGNPCSKTITFNCVATKVKGQGRWVIGGSSDSCP